MDDGTFGLIAIKEAGGAAIVQHPQEAFVPSMTLSAIQNVEVDHVVRAQAIAPLVVKATIEVLQGPGNFASLPVEQRSIRRSRDISLATVRARLYIRAAE